MINGKDSTINAKGCLPFVGSALIDWFQAVTFTLVAKAVVNFEVVETLTTSSFYGVRQPMGPQELKIKPEGQRSWEWEQIHATPDLILKTDDIISIGIILLDLLNGILLRLG